MKAWEKFITEEVNKGYKTIQKRIEYELLHGFDPYPWFFDNNKLVYERYPEAENLLVLTY